jgi:hypothetical protein
VFSAQTTDPAAIGRLRELHIYNEDFGSQRLKWQPDQPVMIVAVRVFSFEAPRVLPVRPEYVGCKSWVTLDAAVPLDAVRPVLDEAAFGARLTRLKSLLA